MEKRLYGQVDGKDIYLYTMQNDKSVAEIMSFGATVVRFKPFGIDIVGGFDTLEDYLADKSFQGVTVGRVCNRIENGELTMDGAVYMLTVNDGNRGNCLHGGSSFASKVWDVIETDDNSITLSYYSEDGEDGFPSGLLTKVRFTLSDADLIIEYEAIPEGRTPIALTNHCFFNLNGFGGTILEHKARIYAERYTEVNDKLIPTGERPEVAGTAFDFTEPKAIGKCLSETLPCYDHNFILSPTVTREFAGKEIGLAATVEAGGLELSVYTDQPGVQFYTGGYLGDGIDFRGGIKPVQHAAFCLEAQTEPNCVNHGEAIYDAGMIYRQTTVYSVKQL